jgi:DNA polymerase II small subunit/DNA polymerase delta subunit B
MLLFQQVKSLVVSGPLLRGTILTLLQKERKISDSISKLLQDLANTVSGDSKPSGALVTAVKACGLSRDISKHTVTTFEVTDS